MMIAMLCLSMNHDITAYAATIFYTSWNNRFPYCCFKAYFCASDINELRCTVLQNG